MSRQHRQAIEESLCSRVRAWQHESHRVWVQLCYSQRLAINDEQIALRRTYGFIQIEGKRKHHVVNVEPMTIGKPNSFAKMKGKTAAIRRDPPRFRKRRLGFLREAVDAD